MVSTDMPQIHLPGAEKFQSYKTSLQDYCVKLGLATPKYLSEKIENGLIGSVSFGSNYVKCKVASPTVKEADAFAAYEALTQLGYLNGQPFVTQQNLLKRKDDTTSMETNSAKKSGTPGVVTAKSHLNQICQKHKLGNPVYNNVSVLGEGVTKGFFSTVTVGAASFKGMAIHSKMREAEHDAAQVALDAAATLLQQSAVTPLNKPSVVATANTNALTSSTPNPTAKSHAGAMKMKLQEYCQKNNIGLPVYDTQHKESITFQSSVTVNGVQYWGVFKPNKKGAEGAAAEVALASLQS